MISKLCDDIYTLFLSGTKENKQKLYSNVHELARYFFLNPITLDALKEVFELERKLLHVKGSHKQFIEERIFHIFTEAALSCSPKKSQHEYIRLNEERIKHERNTEKKQQYVMAFQLVTFAVELFHFKKARDNFNTKRKSLALGILSLLSHDYDIPEAYELSVLSLKSKKKDAIFAALEFQENYVNARGIPLSADVIEQLDTIVLHTKDRSVAVNALDIQIKAGHISEFEALSRIDEWKEHHEYW